MALCYLRMCAVKAQVVGEILGGGGRGRADSLESYEWEACVSAPLSHKNADIGKEHPICIDATFKVPLNHC